MRAKQVRALIVSAIEAIDPDVKASAHDIFTSASAVNDLILKDRAFIVERSAPQEPAGEMLTTLGATPDPYSIRFSLQVFYNNSATLQDRVLDDGDLVCDALRTLTENDQIRTVLIAGSSDLEDSNTLITVWDIGITYDRRAS